MSSLFSNPLVQLAFALIVVLTIASLTAATCIASDLRAGAAVASGFIGIVALGWVMKKVD